VRYVVQTAIVGTCHVEVEAETPEEAKELAVEATSLADVEEWSYVPGFFVEDDEVLTLGA